MANTGHVCHFAAILAGSTTSFNQNQAMGFLKVPLGRMGEELQDDYPIGSMGLVYLPTHLPTHLP